jgi:hypothetical protein
MGDRLDLDIIVKKSDFGCGVYVDEKPVPVECDRGPGFSKEQG